MIVLLVTVGVFAGMSSEGFDRLKEAHFLRDVGLPAVGHLSPVVWFGVFYLVGMALGFVGTTYLIRRFERDGSETIAAALLGLVVFELAAMVMFAVAWSAWAAIAALLGVFLARDLADPLYTIWLNEQITDSSVRATVFSITGQADAIGQAAGGPVIGAIGNVWGFGPRSSRARPRSLRRQRSSHVRSAGTAASPSWRSCRSPRVSVRACPRAPAAPVSRFPPRASGCSRRRRRCRPTR